ncbi:MAG: TIGR00159 family protein [Lachnospiraceae bacterium]|nr:TIGR00159 family protein [Lachnospiraceae bacterium]
MKEAVTQFFGTYFPLKVGTTDIVEIIIISFMIYELLKWIQSTKAWQLLKGIVVILVFIAFAAIFELSTILWLVERALNGLLFAIIIVFQPELRKALEQLGRKKFFAGLLPESTDTNERFSDKTINELVKATYEMAKVKTGALIVIEQDTNLSEYEATGIELDSLVSNQLIINIFEHNTPLHDGAVIMRGNRLTSATCYLPLSDNMELSKELGTRHRAAVGISEATDSFTIVVSEETGSVSIAVGGRIFRNIDAEKLRSHLVRLQNKQIDVKRFRLWKIRNEKAKTMEARNAENTKNKDMAKEAKGTMEDKTQQKEKPEKKQNRRKNKH